MARWLIESSSVPGRSIFRQSAIEAHRRRKERDIVPHLVPAPVIACAWLLIATLAGAAVVAWSVRVPTFTSASGVVVGERAAVLFAPPDDAARVTPGRPVRGQLGSSGKPVDGVVTTIDAGPIGPETARRRYRIGGSAPVVTEPATALSVRL
ncbi:MAG TPA: hypothetical protein VE571_13680, partial [Solirubrobacteraceae bacterium]|nr:hypothetical protein [Solirubrobacteraceae bacterium]